MNQKAFLIIALLCAVAQGAWAWSGEGTADAPYLIESTADWEAFAANVNAGINADNCYKLSDSWNNTGNAVTATVGAEGHPFTGTFDGNGKTLYVNISETTTNGTAPFRDVRGATIENLTVEGSVTGRTHAAGLVGIVRAGGITIVSNCWVRTIVNCSTDGDNHIGGVVGHATTATLTIENTVFSGHLNSIDDYSGGLVGWGGNYSLTIKNSIFTGTHEGNSLFHPIALHGNNDTPTFIEKGAYYLSGIVPELPVNHSNITAAGSVAYTSQPDDGETYIKLKEADGNDYYVGAFTFIRRSWDSESKTVKSETVVKQRVFSTTLSGSHPDTWEGLYGGSDSEGHYYLVKGTVNYKTLNVFGRVNLILCDGAKLTCTGGIKVESDNSAQLNIYSQSDGSSQGQLIVTNSYEDAAGIGGSQGQECGEITIHGGIIDVTGGIRAAGIGAGAYGDEETMRETASPPSMAAQSPHVAANTVPASAAVPAGVGEVATAAPSTSLAAPLRPQVAVMLPVWVAVAVINYMEPIVAQMAASSVAFISVVVRSTPKVATGLPVLAVVTILVTTMLKTARMVALYASITTL